MRIRSNSLELLVVCPFQRTVRNGIRTFVNVMQSMHGRRLVESDRNPRLNASKDSALVLPTRYNSSIDDACPSVNAAAFMIAY